MFLAAGRPARGSTSRTHSWLRKNWDNASNDSKVGRADKYDDDVPYASPFGEQYHYAKSHI